MMPPPWEKLGLRIKAPGTPLAATHAMLPTPLLLDDRIRVFFASCDTGLRGRIYFVDLDRKAPFPVIAAHDEPVIDLGDRSAFDCDGINPSCIMPVDGGLRLYTIGWRRGAAAEPYTLLAGVAHSWDQGLTFEKKPTPVLPASRQERLFRTAPFVWRQADCWNMLYIAGSRFVEEHNGKILPRYALHYMESADGLTWPAEGECLVEPDAAKGQIGFGRPVLHDAGQRLLLSIRTIEGYVLVEADWKQVRQRNFAYKVLLRPGPEIWDGQMTCFGAPLEVDGYQLIFYNGNRFGMTGIGLAQRSIA